MQAPNIVDFAVATSIGVMFFQELEADARVRQFEEIAEACLRLLQHLGRPPYLKSIFDGCSSSFLSPGARSNQCCLGVQVAEKEKALGNISGKQGRFFSCKQYEQALLSIMVCGMAMTRLYCEVTSLLIGNQVALFFAIAFQWLLISYCVRLPMILASRGCLLCFNLGFLCLACLARDVQGGIMGLVHGGQ